MQDELICTGMEQIQRIMTCWFTINDNQTQRLKSRKPPWRFAQKLRSDNFNPITNEIKEWKDKNPDKLNFIENPTTRQLGFYWTRRDWVALNRMRMEHGKTEQLLYNWDLRSTPECDCGSEKTINSTYCWRMPKAISQWRPSKIFTWPHQKPSTRS